MKHILKIKAHPDCMGLYLQECLEKSFLNINEGIISDIVNGGKSSGIVDDHFRYKVLGIDEYIFWVEIKEGWCDNRLISLTADYFYEHKDMLEAYDHLIINEAEGQLGFEVKHIFMKKTGELFVSYIDEGRARRAVFLGNELVYID